MSLLPVPAATPGIQAAPSHLRFLDLLRGLAAQVIVWHHLAFYGPLSDMAYPLAPAFIDFLYGYGAFAVQVFFVVGGFLAAQSLAKAGPLDVRAVAWAGLRRYRRIGLPYLASLGFALLANHVADLLMDHSSISDVPTWQSLAAHVLLLQNILHVPAITAGIWYVAVEFQLFLLVFAVTAASQALARRVGSVSAHACAQASFWVLALASLFWINRNTDLDMWAPYFFGSYFLGMLLFQVVARRVSAVALGGYLLLMAAAVAAEYRPRLLVAGAVAILLYGAARLGLLATWPHNRVVDYLARTSYSLFLIHFPVCLLINGLLWHQRISPLAAAVGMVAAYLASHAAAAAFHHGIEVRCLRTSRPRTGTSAAVAAAASVDRAPS